MVDCIHVRVEMDVQRSRVQNEVKEHLVKSYEDPDTEDYLMAGDTLV